MRRTAQGLWTRRREDAPEKANERRSAEDDHRAGSCGALVKEGSDDQEYEREEAECGSKRSTKGIPDEEAQPMMKP